MSIDTIYVMVGFDRRHISTVRRQSQTGVNVEALQREEDAASDMLRELARSAISLTSIACSSTWCKVLPAGIFLYRLSRKVSLLSVFRGNFIPHIRKEKWWIMFNSHGSIQEDMGFIVSLISLTRKNRHAMLCLTFFRTVQFGCGAC